MKLQQTTHVMGSKAPRGGSCTRDVQVIMMMYTHPPADAYHVMFAEAG